MFEMVMSRVLAIACGHEDATLASQSTISRLENAPSKTEAARLTAALLEQFGTTVKPDNDVTQSPIHVHEAHVGGGLGIRGEIYPRGRAGLRRRDAARPPGEWIEGRREHLVCANHLRPQRHKIRTALDAEGRMSKKGSAARSSRPPGRLTGPFVPVGMLNLIRVVM
jgi:hypothetical protein